MIGFKKIASNPAITIKQKIMNDGLIFGGFDSEDSELKDPEPSESVLGWKSVIV
jgi:hypothetical protein